MRGQLFIERIHSRIQCLVMILIVWILMRMLLLCQLMRGLEMLERLLMMKMKVWNGMLVLMVIVVRVMLVIAIRVMEW
jgi:hypothetical protein